LGDWGRQIGGGEGRFETWFPGGGARAQPVRLVHVRKIRKNGGQRGGDERKRKGPLMRQGGYLKEGFVGENLHGRTLHEKGLIHNFLEGG